MMIGGQSRAVLISVIFEKSMSISGRAKAGGGAVKNVAVEGRLSPLFDHTPILTLCRTRHSRCEEKRKVVEILG